MNLENIQHYSIMVVVEMMRKLKISMFLTHIW